MLTIFFDVYVHSSFVVGGASDKVSHFTVSNIFCSKYITNKTKYRMLETRKKYVDQKFLSKTHPWNKKVTEKTLLSKLHFSWELKFFVFCEWKERLMLRSQLRAQSECEWDSNKLLRLYLSLSFYVSLSLCLSVFLSLTHCTMIAHRGRQWAKNICAHTCECALHATQLTKNVVYLCASKVKESW
jgi:hypothetical protein